MGFVPVNLFILQWLKAMEKDVGVEHQSTAVNSIFHTDADGSRQYRF